MTGFGGVFFVLYDLRWVRPFNSPHPFAMRRREPFRCATGKLITPLETPPLQRVQRDRWLPPCSTVGLRVRHLFRCAQSRQGAAGRSVGPSRRLSSLVQARAATRPFGWVERFRRTRLARMKRTVRSSRRNVRCGRARCLAQRVRPLSESSAKRRLRAMRQLRAATIQRPSFPTVQRSRCATAPSYSPSGRAAMRSSPTTSPPSATCRCCAGWSRRTGATAWAVRPCSVSSGSSPARLAPCSTWTRR